jgi:hypothetical protein
MNRAFYAIAVLGVMLSATAHADGPDYEGTVSYIKSRVNGVLTEQKRCVFGARLQAAQHDHVFDIGKLDLVPSVIKASEVHFDCTKGAQCVTHAAEKKSAVNFSVAEDAQGVAIAISRLIEMCATGHAY